MARSSDKPKRRTKKGRQILRPFLIGFIAREGGIKSQYDADKKLSQYMEERLHTKLKTLNWSTLRRDLNWFERKGYVEVKKGPRNAKSYSLTWRGLLYGLKYHSINSEEGRNLRINNSIPLPTGQENAFSWLADIDFGRITEYMEEKHPEYFYRFISNSIIDIDRINGEQMSTVIALLGFLNMIVKYVLDTENANENFKGEDLILEDGLLVYDIKQKIPWILSVLKPFVPSREQKIFVQKLKELR